MYILYKQHGGSKLSQIFHIIGSFYDVNMLCESNLYKNWHRVFLHLNEYCEYLLNDPSYRGEKMFVM
jgi:hypothetical protein